MDATLSEGTQVALTVDPSAQVFLQKNGPSSGGGDDNLSQSLESSKILKELEDGIRYVRSTGLKVPEKMDVVLVNLPGEDSQSRSHAFFARRKIVFDVSEDIDGALGVHEVTHLATPHLCASASTFLCEGFAVYLEDKYEGSAISSVSVSDAELRRTISGAKFYRSFGDNPGLRRREHLSYRYGGRIWFLLEFLYGPEKVLQIVQQIESDPAPSIGEVFIRLTGYSDRYWIANLYGLEIKKYLPALIEGLKNADPGVRRRAAVALGEMGPDAKEAVPVLIKMRKKKKDLSVRQEASLALAKIDTKAEVSGPAEK